METATNELRLIHYYQFEEGSPVAKFDKEKILQQKFIERGETEGSPWEREVWKEVPVVVLDKGVVNASTSNNSNNS